MGGYRRRFGDRYDGRLIRTIDPFFKIIPYLMRTRMDSQNFYEEKIDIDRIEAFLREKRNNSVKNLSFLHIMLAAMVRTLSQKPGLNRFIAGQKIYARNEILISLAVKKQLLEESPETTIKIAFKPTDTLSEVAEKVNAAVLENKKADTSNDADKTAGLFMKCPGLLVKFLVWVIRLLDYFGILPKVLNQVSPFHTSVFVTDLGSLGIQPVYHHLYDLGTTSVFVAFGHKQKEKIIDKDGNIREKRFVNVKVVSDERICDGFYFASTFKLFKNLVQNPEKLEIPPERVVEDME